MEASFPEFSLLLRTYKAKCVLLRHSSYRLALRTFRH